MDTLLLDVFLLWHTHDLTDDCGTHEEVKLIGVFSSEKKASEASAEADRNDEARPCIGKEAAG